MRKILLLLFVFAFNYIYAANWGGEKSIPQNTIIDGTSFYMLSNAAELAWFASEVNGGRNTINAIMVNDISFYDNTVTKKNHPASWTPMLSFKGIFNGNGYKISGLYYVNNVPFGAFFNQIEVNAQVKNFILSNSFFYAYYKNQDAASGAIFYRNKGQIENVKIEKSVVVKALNAACAVCVGTNIASFGYLNDSAGTLFNIENHADIVADKAFGLVFINSGEIYKATNSGIIQGGNRAGGLVHENKKNGVIKHSENIGNVTSSWNTSTALAFINYGVINKNTNKATISTSRRDCGYLDATNLININSDGGIVSNNSNLGNVINGCPSTRYGILRLNSGTAKNNFFITTSTQSNAGPSSLINTMTNSANANYLKMAWQLNTTNGTEPNSQSWGQNESINDGYPYITEDPESAIYRVIFKIGNDVDTVYSNRKELANILLAYGSTIWFDSFGNELKDVSEVDGDITLHAFYAVSFLNYNNQVLFSDTLAYSTYPSYADSVVVRNSTAQFAYSFKGWSLKVDTVKSAATYVAQFDSTLRSYDILFVDFDNDTLSFDQLAYGTYPSYAESVIERDSTAQHAYSFKGWSPKVDTVKGAATFEAQYDSTVLSYKVSFANYDGDVLQNGILNYGVSVSYKGLTPTKPNSAKYSYSFKGWTPELVEKVTGPAAYRAVFDSTIREFSVTFLDYAGEVLQSSILSYGSSVVFMGTSNPTKPNSSTYSYTFKTWNPKISAAVADVEYVPVFDSTKVFSVTIDNGTIRTDTVATILFVLPDAPMKDGYDFIAWYNKNEKLGKPGDTITVTKNIEISAKWEASSSLASVSAHPQFSLSISGRSLRIGNAEIGSDFALFDMQGRVLYRGIVNNCTLTMNVQNAGAYLIRIGNVFHRVSVR